ncbi:MAG: hypothetical protein ACAH11_11330, partial [Sphingomonas sp.]
AWRRNAKGALVESTAGHDLDDPFDTGRNWSGSIAFGYRAQADDGIRLQNLAASRDATLRDIVIASEPGFRLDPDVIPRRIEVSPGATVASAAAVPEPASEAVVELSCRGQLSARLINIGDQVAVITPPSDVEPDCRVSVNDKPVGGDCRSGSPLCNFRILPEGGTLAISRGEQVLAQYRRRSIDPQHGQVQWRGVSGPLFNPIVQPFAELAWRGLHLRPCRDQLACDAVQPLSLDEVIQHSVFEEVVRATTQGQSDPNPGQPRKASLASIVVMNARTGEVLGIGGGGESLQDCHFQPLCRLPIGSTAKPLFATAITAAQPDLLGLSIRHFSGERESIAGMRVPTVNNLDTHVADGTFVNFKQFLQYSDNFYAETLLLLATARDEGTCAIETDDEYRIAHLENGGASVRVEQFGSKAHARPRSAFESERCAPLGRGGRPLRYRADWTVLLDNLFSISSSRVDDVPAGICGYSGMSGDKYRDTSPWGPLNIGCVMLRPSPMRESFGIDAASDFRGEMVPLILGDGSGTWTAVKVAEAYSRLVIGARIQSSFVKREGTEASPELLPAAVDRRRCQREETWCDSPRIAVLRGMERVIVDGTAGGTEASRAVARLRADIEALRIGNSRFTLRAFAKTGTMELPNETIGGCPVDRRRASKCAGKAFAIVLAVYPMGAAGAPPVSERELWSKTPRCAVTIFVNLPQWYGNDGNVASNAAARLISTDVAARLMDFTAGGYCGG